MDSPSIRVVNKPADRTEARLFNNMTSSDQLNGGSVSEEQQLPVLTRGDDRSAVSSRDLPVEIILHTDLPAEASSQERSTFIYPPISDTESEVIEHSSDRSRKPRKMLGGQKPSPPYGSIYPKPPNTYNRRKFSVNTDSESDDDTPTILEIQRLKDEIQDLEANLLQKKSRATQPQSEPSRYQKLYRIGYEVRPNVRETSSDEYSSPSESDEPNRRGNFWSMGSASPGRKTRSLETFTDPPVLTYDKRGKEWLHSICRLGSLKYFLKSNPDISFVVFYDYNWYPEARVNKPEPNCDTMDNEKFCQPTPCARSIYPVSKELKIALELILKDREEYSSMIRQYWNRNELSAPYLFIYHSRQEILRIKEELSKPAQDQLDLFLEYVMNEFGEEYNTVDTLLQRKEILPQYLHYLIKKGDILVENKNDEYTGYRANSWPIESIRRTPNASILPKWGISGNIHESSYEYDVTRKWTLTGITWGFDGGFLGDGRNSNLRCSRMNLHSQTKLTRKKQQEAKKKRRN
jgi:hypothetical protein